MSINLYAGSLMKLGRVAAIATIVSLVSLPAFAGNKDTKTTESTTPERVSAPMQTETTPVEAPKPEAVSEPKANASSTIMEVAASNASFRTLTAAVKAAGLEETLSGKGPYTVFAPTNEAFAALPPETVAMLMKPENKAKLQKVLAYHVVPGSVESSTLKPGSVNTVAGSPVMIKLMSGKVMINDANVTTPDVRASNGVIHVIDKVMLPPDL